MFLIILLNITGMGHTCAYICIVMSNKFEDDIFGQGVLMLTSLHANIQSITKEYKIHKSSKFDIRYICLYFKQDC